MAISLDGNLGIVSDGNVSTNQYFIGNGSLLTGIQVSSTVPGSNVAFDSNGNAVFNVSGNTIMSVSSSGASVAGNVTASGNIIGGNVVSNTVVTNSVVSNTVTTTGAVTSANLVISNTTPGGGITFADGTFQTTAYSNAQVANYLSSGMDAQNIITTGDVSGHYFLGNGAFLTGLPATYANANVAAFLASGNIANTTMLTGNIIPPVNNFYSLGNATNQWKDLWVSSSTIYINSLPLSAGSANTLTFNNQPLVVSSNTAPPVTSNIATTANVVAGNVVVSNAVPGAGVTFADGTKQTTAAIPYANSNVRAYYASGTANANIITTANVYGTYFIGNGAFLTGIAAGSSYGNANVAAYLPVYTGNANANVITAVRVNAATGNLTSVLATSIVAGNVTTGTTSATTLNTGTGNLSLTGNTISSGSNVVTIDPAGDGGTNGTLNVLGNVIVTGNLTYNDVGTAITSNLVWQAANTANIPALASGGGLAVGPAGSSYATWLYSQSANAWQSNIGASFAGPVVAPVFTGAGNNLSNIQGANVSGYVPNASQANIASIANVAYSVDAANVSGIVANANVANTAVYANTAGVAYSVAGANVTGYVPSATGATIANTANVAYSVAGGNVSGQVANALVSGTVYTNAQPNITSVGVLTSLSTTGNISAVGNVWAAGNISTIGNMSAAGNVTAARFIGDGGLLTNVQVAAGTAIVNGTSNVTVGFNGNVSMGIAGTSGVMVVNPTGASVTGNVAANYYIGNGALLTGIVAGTSYSNANVSAYLASGNANANITTSANIAGAYFVGNGATLGSITGANVTGTVATANYALTANTASTANSVSGANVVGAVALASVAGTVSGNTQSNITALGNLTALSASGAITTTGTVTGASLLVGQGGLSLIGNTISTNSSIITIDPSADGATQGTLNVLGNVVVTGNLTYNDVGTAVTSNLIWQAANTANSNTLASGGGLAVGPAGNAYAKWLYSQSSNAWVANIGGNFAGNVTAPYFIGNGALLTGISSGSSSYLNNANANLALLANSAVTVYNNTTRQLYIGAATDTSIAIGQDAGSPYTGGTGGGSIAIGASAGYSGQGPKTIAIGQGAGFISQGANAIAIGTGAGATQGNLCIGIGMGVHRQYPGTNVSVANAIAIGTMAADTFQRNNAIAIGTMAGYNNQGSNSIAIGAGAGANNQIDGSIILNATGANLDAKVNGGFYVSPIRQDWGNTAQTVYYNPATKELTYLFTGSGVTYISNGSSQVTIPSANGNISMSVGGVQSMNLSTTTVALGQFAGRGNVIAANTVQAANAVAIGANAGYLSQGANSVAIGAMAGYTNQANNSIAINASGANLSPVNSGFYVNPIRNDVANITTPVFYNTSTKEITYGPQISGIANGTSSVNIATANGAITMAVGGSTAFNVTDSNVALGIGAAAASYLGIAIGPNAGSVGDQGQQAVAIGSGAGEQGQGMWSVALGADAGTVNQGQDAVAIGYRSGYLAQGPGTVAIGAHAGEGQIFGGTQGANSIAIGMYAGANAQAANSIILNASGGVLNSSSDGFFVKPLRDNGASAPTQNIIGYDPSTSEVSYHNTISPLVGNAWASAYSASLVGYMGMPQLTKNANYLVGLQDSGKHIYITSNAAMTLPTGGVFQSGTVITFITAPGVTATITSSDTMYQVGTGTTGTRTLGPVGVATAVRMSSSVWYISGTGLS